MCVSVSVCMSVCERVCLNSLMSMCVCKDGCECVYIHHSCIINVSQ